MLKEDRPTKGKIHVLGQELSTLSSGKVPYFRRSLGVVFQDFRLLPNKTVFDNVAFTLQVIGKSKGYIQEAVPDVLKMVGLAGKQGRYPHELSGGEQQRVAIARAVVNKPAILLADEPTGNLDPATSAGIMTLLATINANGTTVLMATHEAGIVDQMKRRVIELVSGQIVRDERQGGYQTQANPIQANPIQTPKPPTVAMPIVNIDDESAAVPTPTPTAARKRPMEPAPTTDPIDVILNPAASTASTATEDQPETDAMDVDEPTPASIPVSVVPHRKRPGHSGTGNRSPSRVPMAQALQKRGDRS